MIIRCWGARGSIPISGKEFSRYGGDTTCLELRTARNDEVLIFDAGSGTRRLANAVMDENRSIFHFFFSHVHWDHILGFPFFKPIYCENTRLVVFGCPEMQGDMDNLLARIMDAPYFPVPYEVIRARIEYRHESHKPIELDGMTIESIPLSHPNKGLGYKMTEDGKSFAFLTDNELEYVHEGGKTFDEYVEFVRGVDVLFHDAEYLPEEYEQKKTWGHSSYTKALELALTAGVKRFGLFHHNQDRPDDAIDAIVEKCRAIIREQGSDLDCFGVTQHTELKL